MEKIFETENVLLEHDSNRSDGEYRLSLFDKYGHFLDEINLDKKHVIDMCQEFKEIEIELDYNIKF